ncbi:hypothetical protein JZ751_003216 [Albula glossodonta]|uniref:Uncharacterized protein n=1 Tax=Albula glossodonta TaxID=121402 RepID=A0A8T2NGU2_9TELE|nr:hypothetical protein JZ751_003216 [Albula glossodonta]
MQLHLAARLQPNVPNLVGLAGPINVLVSTWSSARRYAERSAELQNLSDVSPNAPESLRHKVFDFFTKSSTPVSSTHKPGSAPQPREGHEASFINVK